MEEFNIPHATNAFIDRSRFPHEVLVVATYLPEHSAAGPEADARYDMLKEIANAEADNRLQGHEIHWSTGGAGSGLTRPSSLQGFVGKL
jgi:hypothetical protein